MKKIALLTLFVPFFAYSATNPFDNMSQEDAQKTGVYKLSQQEQKALLAWLKSSKKEIIKKEKVKNMGFRKEESGREEIHSSIVGEFKGWKGKNIFKLVNGQIWKQAEAGSFYIPKRTNPNISIKPKSMNTWVLYVDGFGRGVRVKRIK